MNPLGSIPTEVFVGLASAALGMFSQAQKDKAEVALVYAKVAASHAAIANDSADRAAGRGGKWTRRILALMAGSYIFVWPSVWALLWIFDVKVPTSYLYNQDGGGFWVFKGAARLYEALTYGFVITPLQTHLGSAVFFFYFGSRMGKK